MGSIGNLASNPEAIAYSFTPENTIFTDVCVIGGGAAGTYTAVRIKDLGFNVTLIERNGRLGGHAENYHHEQSNQTLDVGVIVFGHTEEVKKTFERFQIPLKVAPVIINPPDYVDFGTGQTIEFQPPTQEAISAAIQKYAAELTKYPQLQAGFDIPDPVPEDLMLPFGDFVKKHQLEALVPAVFAYCHGYLPLLELSTIYVFKYFNLELIKTLSQGFLMTEKNNVGSLYEKIGEHLGASNVLLESTISHMDRNATNNNDHVNIIINTPTGEKLIKAQRIVSTIPHNIKNVSSWDLSEDERKLFSQFEYSAYYAGIVQHTGLSQFHPIHAYGNQIRYGIPKLPGLYAINPSKIPGVYQWYFGSPTALSEDEVRTKVTESIRKIQKARGISQTDNSDNTNEAPNGPEIVKFADHTPFNHTVPAEAIRKGFYRDLMALQGQRKTFYHGASFHTQDTTLLWRLTEQLLPRILDGVTQHGVLKM